MLSVNKLAALIDLAQRGPHTAAEGLFIEACVAEINAALSEQKQATETPPAAPTGETNVT